MVCTEEVEIHPTSDVTPYVEGRLWDDRDIRHMHVSRKRSTTAVPSPVSSSPTTECPQPT